MKFINQFFTIGLLLSILSCGPEECCDSGDRRPSFFYLDQDGNDLLNPNHPNGYDWDSITMELIQFDITYDVLPDIDGFWVNELTNDTIQDKYTIRPKSFKGYNIAETEETLFIHLNHLETDTIIYETYFPNKKDPAYTHYRNLTINGISIETGGLDFVTIYKNK